MPKASQIAASIVRVILIIFTILNIIIGLAFIGIGIAILLYGAQVLGTLTSKVSSLDKTTAYVVIAIGGWIFLTTIFGCLGSIRKSNALLRIYRFLLIFNLIIIIGLGTYVLVSISKSKGNSIDYSTYSSLTVDERLSIQIGGSCCGYKSNDNSTVIGQNKSISSSIDASLNPCVDSTVASKIQGCIDVINNALDNIIKYSGTAFAIAVLIAIVAIVFTTISLRSARKEIEEAP